MYENIEFISKPDRKPNGYRVFTDVHLEQMKLIRLALRGEILQSGLRKEAIQVIKISALGDYEAALEKTENYLNHLKKEYENAKEAANYLGITIDTLRNWELNGLVSIPRRKNGFRIYTIKEIQILKIIRTLRCANYSLMSILRMLNALAVNRSINLIEVIDTPNETEDIVSVCDRLLTCLKNTKEDGILIIFSTSHYMDEIEALCDTICIIKKGKMIFKGTVPEAIQNSPCDNLEEAYLWFTEEEDLKNESF